MQATALGPLKLSVHDSVPAPSRAYFTVAASSALQRMRDVGFSDEVLAGPVAFTIPDEDSAGWYESASDQLVIHARLGADTAGGRRPEDYFGADPTTGFLTWAICHELAHRIWYRGLSAEGRALWQRFVAVQGKPLSKDDLLGVAWRAALTCYGVEGWVDVLAAVGKCFDATPRAAMKAASGMPKTVRALGAALWGGWLRTRQYGGVPCAQAATRFMSWLKDGEYRNAVLPTVYAEESYKEAWGEAVAALAGAQAERGDVIDVVVSAVVAAPGERETVPGRASLSWAPGDEAARGRVREAIWSQ